jgi:CRP-like cAMP-binding protein
MPDRYVPSHGQPRHAVFALHIVARRTSSDSSAASPLAKHDGAAFGEQRWGHEPTERKITSMNPTIQKLCTVLELSDEERAYLMKLQGTAHRIPKGRQIVVEGEVYEDIYLLRAGWAFRCKFISDGRRQVFGYLIPGDMIGLRASLLEFADNTVEALTDCEIASFPIERLQDACRAYPRLVMALMWSSARDQSMLREQVMRIGRRTAIERVAHFFLELLRRLQLVDAADRQSFELPLTQELIADTLGLSTVHVNRTLQKLRKRGLVELGDGHLYIPDIDALDALADFDPTYLDQEHHAVAFFGAGRAA